MANRIYASVSGKNQGLISAGCSTFDSIGNRFQHGHENEIMVLYFEHELTRLQHVNHGPVSFIKPIDKSTPLFGIALDNNESLDVVFKKYRTSAAGNSELYFSIKLTGATVVNMKVIYPHVTDDNESQPEEMIRLLYRNITWQHHIAGTSGYSIWDDRIY